MQIFHIISEIIAIASIAILVFGGLQAMGVFLSNELARFRGQYNVSRITEMRLQLGQYLLLGLELLIASDVIETIANPGLNELAQVGGVVLIRTVLSFFLNREIEAHRREKV
jgi:uncharacterized membrane protein